MKYENDMENNPTGVSVNLFITITPTGEPAVLYKPEIADGDILCMEREEARLMVRALEKAMKVEDALNEIWKKNDNEEE